MLGGGTVAMAAVLLCGLTLQSRRKLFQRHSLPRAIDVNTHHPVAIVVPVETVGVEVMGVVAGDHMDSQLAVEDQGDASLGRLAMGMPSGWPVMGVVRVGTRDERHQRDRDREAEHGETKPSKPGGSRHCLLPLASGARRL